MKNHQQALRRSPRLRELKAKLSMPRRSPRLKALRENSSLTPIHLDEYDHAMLFPRRTRPALHEKRNSSLPQTPPSILRKFPTSASSRSVNSINSNSDTVTFGVNEFAQFDITDPPDRILRITDDIEVTELLPTVNGEVQGMRPPYLSQRDLDVTDTDELLTVSQDTANEVVNDSYTRVGFSFVKVVFLIISGFTSFLMIGIGLLECFNQDLKDEI